MIDKNDGLRRTILCWVIHRIVFVISGVVAIKCYECNSKLDPRCGDTFNNYTIALVDCEQKKKNDISHIDDEQLAMYNRDVDEEGKYITEIIDKDAKQLSFCRKTMQTSNNSIWFCCNSEFI